MTTFDVQPLDDDLAEEVVSVINAAFGFERSMDWYQWKHRDGPWGPSTGVVARDRQGIVGVRLLLPWRFVGPAGALDAHRAVEAATHPRARGQGVFSLVNRYLMEATTEGPPTCIFSTPNEQSRGGYAKLGWSWLTPVPHVWRPVLPRRWRGPIEDAEGSIDLPTRSAPPPGIATDWSAPSIAWRLDRRSGHRYRTLVDPTTGAAIAYRPLEQSRGVALLPLFSIGDARIGRRLWSEAARRERALFLLDTGAPGGTPVVRTPGKSRGRSLIAVWPTPTLDLARWPLDDVENWRVGFADVENVL